ncbi:MAG TPA: hypothetical protein VOB72_24085, partial [Candidatus Dormibacteraeota bacterium]|nr:hypothetical protein [Candidatus Dormibacteraeota bacterium]
MQVAFLPSGWQIYVQSEDAAGVVSCLEEYVREFGCSTVMEFDSEEPTPWRPNRTERVFTVSTPRDGYTCVWEDGLWADKRLAERLSLRLSTRAIWLMLSSTTDEWGHIDYESGNRVAAEVSASEDYLREARRYAAARRLPFAFTYFEDPGMGALLADMEAEYGADKLYGDEEALAELEADLGMDDPVVDVAELDPEETDAADLPGDTPIDT